MNSLSRFTRSTQSEQMYFLTDLAVASGVGSRKAPATVMP